MSRPNSQVAPPLPFADDLCLTSLSMQGLHMDTLQAFCKDRGMTVNLSKTKLVVVQHRYALLLSGVILCKFCRDLGRRKISSGRIWLANKS